MSTFLNKLTKFINLKDLVQSFIVIIITVFVTNYCNDSRQNINNYRRLSQELEWNLSELREYDEYLGKIENYVNSSKLLSVKENQQFNPMLPFPIAFTYSYLLVNDNSDKDNYKFDDKFDIQTRNYIIGELKNSGFLYNIKNKEYIKYIEKMSDSDWLVSIINPLDNILVFINNLTKRKSFGSKKLAVEKKQNVENECNIIVGKINVLRNDLKTHIKKIEEIISYINELA